MHSSHPHRAPVVLGFVASALAFALALGACEAPVGRERQARSESGFASIVGGTTARIAEWPGIVQLQGTGGAFCGAALVANEWVVTAAHCVTEPTRGLAAAIGRERTSAGTGEVVPVTQTIVHEGYSDRAANSDNDIALLRLARPSALAKARLVRAAEWAAIEQAATPPAFTVAGWGLTEENGQGLSDVLRQVSVPFVPQAACKGVYGAALTANMFCAGERAGGKDSCQGDSGGPIYAVIGGAKVQVGVVSWGEGCARAGSPGVYTRLANYAAWLAARSNGAVDATTPVATDGGAPTPVDAGPPAPAPDASSPPVPVTDAGSTTTKDTPAPAPSSSSSSSSKTDKRDPDVEDADEEEDEDEDEDESTIRTKKPTGSAAIRPQVMACQASPGIDPDMTFAALLALACLGRVRVLRRR